MQTLHFTLAASGRLPPALQMLQLSLHSLCNAGRGKKKETSWVTDGACSAPSQCQQTHGYYVFFLVLYCFRNRQCPAMASQGTSFAKRQQEEGQSQRTFRKTNPGDCFSELGRLQPLSKPDGFNQFIVSPLPQGQKPYSFITTFLTPAPFLILLLTDCCR